MDINQFWEEMSKVKWAEPEKEDVILQELKRRIEVKENAVKKLLKEFPTKIQNSIDIGHSVSTYTFSDDHELEAVLFVKALLNIKVPIKRFFKNYTVTYVEIPINALLNKEGSPKFPPTTNLPILEMPKTPLLGDKR
jgi:hypothetical protein